MITVIRENPDSTDGSTVTESENEVTPDCDSVLRAERAEWRAPHELTEGLRAFWDPCESCWPDRDPEIGATITRSTSNRAGVFHRVQESDGGEQKQLVADGGDEYPRSIEGHLQWIKENAETERARYHARAALGRLPLLEGRPKNEDPASETDRTPFDGCPECGGVLDCPTRSDRICQDCGQEFCHETRDGRHLLWSFDDDYRLNEVVARAE